jgi:8-oxo-dGTP diphosphatase
MYDYPSIMAVKIVVIREGKILVIREPETNEWMPGRLGLPGGKLLLNETISEATKRKIETEIGLKVEIKGFVNLIDILMPDKNVYHLIVLAEYISGEIGELETESKELSWLGKLDIENLVNDDFTEFYNRELLISLLDDKIIPISLSFVSEQDNCSKEIMEWMEKGKRRN